MIRLKVPTVLAIMICVASGCGEEEVPEPILQPGHYLPPIVQLQRVQGNENHMHVAQVRYRESDNMLLYCSYGFGMIDASNPQDMEYVVQDLQHMTASGSPREPGCLHLTWDEDDPNIVYTTHRGNIDFAVFLSGWDLTDPEAPVQLPALQEAGVRYGGLDFENGLIYVALQEGGLGIYDYDAMNGFVQLSVATGLENAWAVHVVGDVAYVADGTGGLATVDVADPMAPSFIGRVPFGGVAEDIVVADNTAYVAAGSAGMVIVDVADPAAPAVLSEVPTDGSAVGVAYSDGRAYVAAWNDTRVYDVTDPAEPSMITSLRLTVEQDYESCSGDPEMCVPDAARPDPTARTLAVAAHGETMFVGNWWVPYSFQLFPERTAPHLVMPEDAALIDFGPTDVDASNTHELVIGNDGNEPLTLYDNWVDNEAFSVSPTQVRIEPGESATLTLTYTATTDTMETGVLHVRSDDPLQPIRKAYLVGNQPGLGVGQPMPEVLVTRFDGSSYSTAPLTGSVMLLAYFATF